MRSLAAFMHRSTQYLSQDLLGGPRPWKFSWVINFQKGGTLPFVLLLMVAFQNFSTTAWLYAALHGSYGLLWLLKDVTFPDPGWQKRVTLAGGLVSFLAVLGPYWSFAYLLVSDVGRPEAPAWLMFLSTALYALGVGIMLAADAQKYFTLQLRRGLIETGMFRHIRHPNYLGEMMLYGAFALLTQHPFPWVVLGWVWLGVFLPNMLTKEASMSRYPQWSAYAARTGMLLPPLRALWGGTSAPASSPVPSTAAASGSPSALHAPVAASSSPSAAGPV